MGAGGKVLRLVRGSWTVVARGLGERLTAVDFAGDLAGWAVGTGGTIAATVDGGLTWSPQPSGTRGDLRAVCAVAPDEAWAVGDDGLALRTLGDGRWSPVHLGTDLDLRAVWFSDRMNGWVAGGAPYGAEPALILHTTDGGLTWAPQSVPLWGRIHALSFVSPATGWAVGEDWGLDGDEGAAAILATRDGGATWVEQHAPCARVPRAVTFVDELHGLAAGDHGTVLATADGGTTWLPQVPGTGLQLSAALLVSRTRGWVAGDHGAVLTTTTGGFPSR